MRSINEPSGHRQELLHATGSVLSITRSNVGLQNGDRIVSILSILASVWSYTALADPQIISQPSRQHVRPGGTIVETVEVGESGQSYQWFKGNEPIEGATNSTLVVKNAQASDTAGYSVIITDPTGQTISERVGVVVTDAPAAELWVNSFWEGRVLKFDTASGEYLGDAAKGVPNGIQNFELGPDGKVYCASPFGNAVYRCDPANGDGLETVLPNATDGMYNIIGLAWAPNNRLWLGSWGTSTVNLYQGTTGHFIRHVATVNQPSGFAGGNDVGVGADGTVYASSYGDGTIKAFSPSGEFIGSTEYGRTKGFDNLTSFTITDNGDFLVANGIGGGSITPISSQTGQIQSPLISGSSGGLNVPYGLRKGADGIIYIANGPNVLRFNGQSGEFIDEFVTSPTAGLGFAVWVRYMPSARDMLPHITLQPGNMAGIPGGQYELSVTAYAANSPSFEWRKDGINIPGGNESILSIGYSNRAVLGAYDVVVATSSGAVTSTVAQVSLATAVKPPNAGPVTFQFIPATPLKINVHDILLACSDPLGLPLKITSSDNLSARGGKLKKSGNWIFYTPPKPSPSGDQFTCTVDNGWSSVQAVVTLASTAQKPGPVGGGLISTVPLSNGSLQLIFLGIPGRLYNVEYSLKKGEPVWNRLGSAAANSKGYVVVNDPNPGNPLEHIYRLTENPL